MALWNTNCVPKCKKRTHSNEVLVTVDNGRYQRVLKAVYIPYHHCTVQDLGWYMWDEIPDGWEYVEEEDTWWIPQGWYEVADNFEEYAFAIINDKVVAWQKLPKPYKTSVKKL